MLRFINKINPQVNKRFTSTLTTARQVNGTQLQSWLLKKKANTIHNGITLIDVRERQEVEKFGKIESAINIPFKLDPSVFIAGMSDLNKEDKIVFQCMSGRRSDEAAILAEKNGFKQVYSLSGGLKEWDGPVQPFKNNHSPWVHTIFDTDTETAQYIVTDLETKEAFIVDPVLNYDPFSSAVSPLLAKSLIRFIENHQLNVSKIIDTHVHADHLTAAYYLKSKLKEQPEYWIGKEVTQVQQVFGQKYNLAECELKTNGEQFDQLVTEGMSWKLGKDINCTVLATPGHTPACISYLIGDAAFVGDTLFMPDLGTARCDFPGGSAEEMYKSIHKMYDTWPNDTRIYVGHDYPPSDRPYQVMTSLENHKMSNKMINSNVTMEEYTRLRQERDAKLKAPRYIHPSIQTNLRGGILPSPEVSIHDKKTAQQYFKIPVLWKPS